MYIYMQVTADKYELPLFVGCLAEMAKRLNISKKTVIWSSSHPDKATGKNKGYKIVKVKDND